MKKVKCPDCAETRTIEDNVILSLCNSCVDVEMVVQDGEFNLSDKILPKDNRQTQWIFKKDVREAVKKLKFKVEFSEDKAYINRWIDKIFGEKLI